MKIKSSLTSDRENYFWRAGQNFRQAVSALPDILSTGQTFFTVDDWQIICGHSCFPCRILYVFRTLLDKTSPKVCRTCPAYFAITALTLFYI